MTKRHTKKKKEKKPRDLTQYFHEFLIAEPRYPFIFNFEFQFHESRKWKFDVAILCCHVAIEIEGGGSFGRHTRHVGFMKDMEKYNQAAIEGWKLLRFIPKQITILPPEGIISFLDILDNFFYNNPCPHLSSKNSRKELRDLCLPKSLTGNFAPH